MFPVDHARVEVGHDFDEIDVERDDGPFRTETIEKPAPQMRAVERHQVRRLGDCPLLHATDSTRISCVTQPTAYNDAMPSRKSLDHLRCSIANTAELIGDRWTVLIIRDAFMGVRRFDDFQKDLGIARNVLTERLSMLVDNEILFTSQYEERPPRFEYRLTPKGKDLFDLIVAMWRWGDRWSPPDDDFLRTLVHNECGAHTHGVVACEHCGAKIDHRNTRLVPLLTAVGERQSATA